ARLEPAALPAVMALHAAEPVRFERSTADWQRLLGTCVVFFDPGAVFTVTREGRVVAYLALGERDAERAATTGATWRALELGGDRAALALAVPSLLDQLGAEALDLVVPGYDRSLEAVGARHG